MDYRSYFGAMPDERTSERYGNYASACLTETNSDFALYPNGYYASALVGSDAMLLPLFEGSVGVCRSDCSRKLITCIPRPPNAFDLFRSSYLTSLESQHVPSKVETNHISLFKTISLAWANLSDEEHQFWHAQAKVALDDHKRMFPSHAFKPIHTVMSSTAVFDESYLLDTDTDTDTDTWLSPHLPVRREIMIQKRKSDESMIQGKEITISGGKLTNVGGDYHEHNTTYVIEETPTSRGYLETLNDRLKNLETILNKSFISFPKEDNTKSDDSTRQAMHSPSRMENENMGDTSTINHVTEIQFDHPPQPTSAFYDEYHFYQTPAPSRTNVFTPNSWTFWDMDQDGPNSPSGNQLPYPFSHLPVLVPGIVHYFPSWFPSWGGRIASWISWISPPWMWPSFITLTVVRYGHKFSDRYFSAGEQHIPTASRKSEK